MAEIKSWIFLGLDAMQLAFNSNGTINSNADLKNKKRAIDLLSQCVYTYRADEAWPYIKLAELIDDHKVKMSLYLESLKYEPTIYAYRYIFDHLDNECKESFSKYMILYEKT